MSTNYSKHFPSRKTTEATPQSQPIPYSGQVKNNAGGFVYEIDKWSRLDRFLILGSEGGTYYVGERKLTRDNANNLLGCISEDGVRVVARIVEISDSGRAPKNDPALFALALCASADLSEAEKKGANAKMRSLYYSEVRRAALAALPQVARIGTHLFHFAEIVQSFRGWGRALRNAVANWYDSKELDQLIHQVTKYKSRDGWSHRDLLRLSHPKAGDATRNLVYKWVTNPKETKLGRTKALEPLRAAVQLSTETDPKEAVKLIREFGLPRECVNTELLKNRDVWAQLLQDMPATATIRNLGKMTSIGLLAPLSAGTKLVVEKFSDRAWLRKARVHPLTILVALEQYRQGRGDKGSLTWQPVQQILDALDGAFYAAFDTIEPTGKNILIAVDCSASMTWDNAKIAGTNITARQASAVLAMVTAASEKNYHIVGFTNGSYKSQWGHVGSGLTPLPITPRMRLDTAIKEIEKVPVGGTDCALPMIYALDQKLDVDAFIVLTDNETWAGSIHPTQALNNYRQKMGKLSKLIVAGMTATNFSIADPKDRGMIDLVGFDTSSPAVMADFIRE